MIMWARYLIWAFGRCGYAFPPPIGFLPVRFGGIIPTRRDRLKYYAQHGHWWICCQIDRLAGISRRKTFNHLGQ
jgi:hypothetical protein